MYPKVVAASLQDSVEDSDDDDEDGDGDYEASPMQDAQESMNTMEALTSALEQQTRELELLKQQLAEQMVSTSVTVMCCSVQLSPL